MAPFRQHLACVLRMDRRGDFRYCQYFYNEGPKMQPVGSEHGLAVAHPTRSRIRTADSAVHAANDCVQPSVTVNDASVPPA